MGGRGEAQTCRLNQSNREPQFLQPSFPDTVIMDHEGHNAVILPHCTPLVNVTVLAKGKEALNRARPFHHRNEQKDPIFKR